MNAESKQAGTKAVPGLLASMRPRPNERGKQFSLGLCVLDKRLLQ